MAKFKINHGLSSVINNEEIDVGTVWACDDTEEVFADIDFSIKQDGSIKRRIQISGNSVKKIRKKDNKGKYLNKYIDIEDLVLKEDTLDYNQGGTNAKSLEEAKNNLGITSLENIAVKVNPLAEYLQFNFDDNTSDTIELITTNLNQKIDNVQNTATTQYTTLSEEVNSSNETINSLKTHALMYGVNWIETTMPKSANWSSVTYVHSDTGIGDMFIAVASHTRQCIAYSYDGITWSMSNITATIDPSKFTSLVNKNNQIYLSENNGRIFYFNLQDILSENNEILNWIILSEPFEKKWSCLYDI